MGIIIYTIPGTASPIGILPLWNFLGQAQVTKGVIFLKRFNLSNFHCVNDMGREVVDGSVLKSGTLRTGSDNPIPYTGSTADDRFTNCKRANIPKRIRGSSVIDS